MSDESSVRNLLQERALEDFYFFTKVILQYKDMVAHFHGSICRFIQDTEDPGGMSRRLILLPRSTFKSTIATISYPIWRLCKNSNLRILIISDTEKNASRFLKEIKNHFQFNEKFRGTFPDLIPQNFNTANWSATEMTVANRTAVWRDPSIDAIGMGGGAESRHYDLIIADDTITEKAIHSDLEMEKSIEWTGGLESLLVKPEDEIFWIGSRKRINDLYDAIIRKFGGGKDVEEVPIGPHAVRKGDMLIYSRSAIEDGKSIFPERIKLSFLTRLAETDPHRYNSQYANNPISSGLNFFRPEDINFFQWDDQGNVVGPFGPNGEEISISPFGMERILIFDPSKAEKQTSSKNAQLILGKAPHLPFRFVLSGKVDHYTPDVAVDLLYEYNKKWRPGLISIEHRGFQGSIKYWLEEKSERDGLPYLPVVEWPFQGSEKAQWSKTERIRGLIPMTRSGYLWLAPEFRNDELHEELLYYPNVKWDDGVDGLSMSLDFWPWLVGMEDVASRRNLEQTHVAGLLGAPIEDEKEKFNEEEFFSQMDVSGYGFRIPNSGG